MKSTRLEKKTNYEIILQTIYMNIDSENKF